MKPEEVQNEGRSKHARSLRLLVVDDNPDTDQSLAMLLLGYGHEVESENTGPSALQVSLAAEWDVIILDIGLPGIDGYEVARRIRAQSEKPVLIAMTGYGQPDDRGNSKEAGFDYHLTKPVDPARLQELLAKIGEQ